MSDSQGSRHATATGYDALLSSASSSNLNGKDTLYPQQRGTFVRKNSDIDLAPPPPIQDGAQQSINSRNNSSNNRTSVSRPGSRTSMLSTAETYRTTASSFDRRPAIIPTAPTPERSASPLVQDSLRYHTGAVSPSLAFNYVPNKFSTRVYQQDRSHSPAPGGIFASRSAARLRPPPRFPSENSRASSADDEHDDGVVKGDAAQRAGAVTPFTTAVQRAAAQNPAQASRLRHSIRRGAGRSAWGPNGGGNPVLGAGGYEDDDGVDLSRTASQRRRLRQRNEAGAMNESGFNPGEADRRRTSMLHSDLGHFTEIADSEDGEGRESENTQQAQANVQRRKSSKQRQMRKDDDDPSAKRRSRLAGSRLAYLVGFHDVDEDADEDQDPDRFADTVGLAQPQGRSAGAATSGRELGNRRARWNPFKWVMICANLVLTMYAIAGLFGTLLTWANIFENAATVRVGNRAELILSTIASGLCLVAALIGWAGILLNNRAFLSIYVVFLWVAFFFIMAPGYMTFKRRQFNLEGKLNQQWSRGLSVGGRLVIQDELNCCGYYSPFVLASASGRCYARSLLPGCKGRYMRFQRTALQYFYICAFGVVGPHLLIITIALLCSNHVTYRFGKGLTPEEYRLDEVTAELIKEQFLKNPPEIITPSNGSADDHPTLAGKPTREDLFGMAAASEKGKVFDEASSMGTANNAVDSYDRRWNGNGNGNGDGRADVRALSKERRSGEAHEMQTMGTTAGRRPKGSAASSPGASPGLSPTSAPPGPDGTGGAAANVAELRLMPLLLPAGLADTRFSNSTTTMTSPEDESRLLQQPPHIGGTAMTGNGTQDSYQTAPLKHQLSNHELRKEEEGKDPMTPNGAGRQPAQPPSPSWADRNVYYAK
ncbi:unnamed protein product [Tilletia laevis]|nr:unnamed protein product [Tilletia caries]CAD6949025.1 unnamed protein product [Tilletia caries]CAD6954639.1 unnamed protein product [Tilletia laevis]